METRTILRVFVNENDIRKITLPVKPQTIDSLLEQLEEKLGLPFKFSLQFEDPDFNNSLVNLTDIAELPDKPTLKIVSLVTTPTPSTADTEILSTDSDHSSSQVKRSAWPEPFEIPTFPVDIEYRLRQGNLQYMRDQKYLQVSGELKHEILEKLSETIYVFKAYPDKENFEDVAAALIKKHPCLTLPGSCKGWNGWYDSLRWKMGNYRSKLRRAGCLDVSINAGKRRGQQPQKSIKKSKRYEINFLPNFPEGEDETSMESKRKEIVEEMKKRRPNAMLIAQNMNSTFALRRKELIEGEPAVKCTVERWPALFTESQVLAEFSRISGKNLQSEFFQEIDRFLQRFLDIFKAKGGDVGCKLKKILQQVDNNKSDTNGRRTAVLHGLPLLLGEDPTDFYNTCLDSDGEEGLSSISIGILTVIPEDCESVPYSLHLDAASIALILEVWVIYVGNGFVIHLAPPSEHANAGAYSMISVACDRATVKKEEIWKVVGSDKYRINNLLDENYEPRPIREILREAESLVGNKLPYCVFRGNCEHFVTELRYGKPESRQVRKAMEIGVGVGVAAIVGFGVLALAATLFGSKDKEKQSK